MEYGLGPEIENTPRRGDKVLILVLMEYGLGRFAGGLRSRCVPLVLILVLME